MKCKHLLFESLEPRRLLAAVQWTGLGNGIDWSDPLNWANATTPSDFDTAVFTQEGSVELPGEITSRLDEDRTLGGLAYVTTGHNDHTTDLGGHRLSVQGNINFNSSLPSSGVHRLQNGQLVVVAPLAAVNSGGNATADLSGLEDFNGQLAKVVVGDDDLGEGTLLLAQSNHLDATTILVGDNSRGVLRFGLANVVETNELLIAKDYGSGTVEIPNHGTLSVGSLEQPALVSIADQTNNTNSRFTGQLNLTSAASFDAVLDGVIVARKFGGPGNTVGEFIGGRSGAIQVGTPARPAAFIVGQSVDGGNVSGYLDWGSQTSLDAYVDHWIIGQRFEGTASARVFLPQTSRIFARSVTIADNAQGSLTLGDSTTISARNIVIGRGSGASGSVSVPAGGTITVGSADQRANFEIGRVVEGCNCLRTSTFDAGSGTFVGYLDHVVIADKDPRAGNSLASVVLSSNPENVLDAKVVTLGRGERSTGTLLIGGGDVTIGQLRRGAGTAEFLWSGGTLHVDEFGSAAAPLDLDNNGTGKLAPGQSAGKTTVFGDYRQGAHAVLELELGGTEPIAEHDVFKVTGRATLGGTLSVSLIGDTPFQPRLGDRFDLFDFGTVSGQFSKIVLPELPPSLRWDTSNLLASGEIFVKGSEIRGNVLEVGAGGDVDLGASAVQWRVENGGNGNYFALSTSQTWHGAKAEAVARGGYLATITSEQEQAFVDAHFPATSSQFYWIGLTDEVVEGNFEWVTGEEFRYSNWRTGQPDDAQRIEDYVHLRSGGWNDLPASRVFPGLIEFDGESPLADWTVYLDTNDNGQLDSGETSILTGVDGEYAFEGLPLGDYVVRQVLRPEWVPDQPATGVYRFNLGSAAVLDGADFGNRRLPSVTLDVDAALISEPEGVATITAYLSAPAVDPVTVALNFTGTAATEDYSVADHQIVIPTGATSGSVTLVAFDDALPEENETVVVEVATVLNGTEQNEQRVLITILDEDGSYSEAVLASEPLGYWRLGEANGPIAIDSSTNRLDGQYAGGAGLGIAGAISGDDDTAAFFDGSASVVAAHSEFNQLTNNFTLEAWVQLVPGGDVALFSTRSGGPNGYVLHIDGGRLVFTTYGIKSYRGTRAVLAEGEWTHVALVFDSQNDASFFINGESIQTVGGGSPARTNAQPLTIGRLPVIDNGSYWGLHGSLDEVAVYDRALTAEEIRLHFLVAARTSSGFTVTVLEPTATGFAAEFSRNIDPSPLSLLGAGSPTIEMRDARLVGEATGEVEGSLVVDRSLRKVTFIKSGGPLAADNYTLTLRSAADGFVDAAGHVLDGDGDGFAGDDFTSTFTVGSAAPNSIIVNVPDFVRGPGQEVHLPAGSAQGIPLTISNGASVRTIALRIRFDPAYLEFSSAFPGAGTPSGAIVLVNELTPGLLIVTFASPTSLPDGPITFAQLHARVPQETSGQNSIRAHVLDIHSVSISDGNDNEFPVIDDDALHVVTYVGDVTGNRRVDASDAAQVARYAALASPGFKGSQQIDPRMLADVSGNGRVNSLDAARIAGLVAGLEPTAAQRTSVLAGFRSGNGDPSAFADTDLAFATATEWNEDSPYPVAVALTERLVVQNAGYTLEPEEEEEFRARQRADQSVEELVILASER